MALAGVLAGCAQPAPPAEIEAGRPAAAWRIGDGEPLQTTTAALRTDQLAEEPVAAAGRGVQVRLGGRFRSHARIALDANDGKTVRCD